MKRIASFLFALLISAQAIAADNPDLEKGKQIAMDHCARCHSIEAIGKSSFEPAPPLRVIARKYPADDLSEAFAEGISVGHPAMPEFTFEPNEINNLLGYIASLK